MLAETLSCVKAKDRDLGSVVAKDYARYDGARLNINRRGDPRKHDVWHPALSLSLSLVLPTDWMSVFLAATGVGSGEGRLRHRADGDREQGSILTTQTRCGLEHAWVGGEAKKVGGGWCRE